MCFGKWDRLHRINLGISEIQCSVFFYFHLHSVRFVHHFVLNPSLKSTFAPHLILKCNAKIPCFVSTVRRMRTQLARSSSHFVSSRHIRLHSKLMLLWATIAKFGRLHHQVALLGPGVEVEASNSFAAVPLNVSSTCIRAMLVPSLLM